MKASARRNQLTDRPSTSESDSVVDVCAENREYLLGDVAVRTRIHRVQLTFCDYLAKAVHADLISRLEKDGFCRRVSHVYAGRRGYPVDTFVCSDDAEIRLVLYRDTYLSVQFKNATPAMQTNLRMALRRVLSSYGIALTRMSLSQVEFAVDFHARRDRYADLSLLLPSSVVLKHTKGNASHIYFGKGGQTHYQGNKGYVRTRKLPNGKQVTCAKGLRCYLRTDNGPYRIELHANRAFLRKKRLSILNLPLSADAIDILDYLDFRQGLTEEGLWHLTEVICKSGGPGYRQMPDRRKAVVLDAFRRDVDAELAKAMHKAIGVGLMCFGLSDLPVAVQMAAVKTLKKRYGFTHQIDDFFPKDAQFKEQIKARIQQSTSSSL